MNTHHQSAANNRSIKLYGFFMVVVATTLFSSKAVLIKLSYHYGATPDIIMTLRMIFSAPVYLIIAISTRRTYKQPVSSSTLAFTALLGVFGYYLASAFDLYGLQYISASLERLILYIYPTIVIIMSAIFLNTPIKRSLILCIIVIYSGLVLALTKDAGFSAPSALAITTLDKLPPIYIGGGLVLISALCFSIYIVGSDYIMRTLPSRLFTAYAMLAACVLIFLHFLLRHPVALLFEQSREIYYLGLLIAIFCTVLPSFLLSAGIQKVGAATAGAVGSLGPVSTLALAALVLGEQINLLQLPGFAIVIGGVMLLGKLQSR